MSAFFSLPEDVSYQSNLAFARRRLPTRRENKLFLKTDAGSRWKPHCLFQVWLKTAGRSDSTIEKDSLHFAKQTPDLESGGRRFASRPRQRLS
jgi:hypothetical protein